MNRLELLIDKLPVFDPHWTQETIDRWFALWLSLWEIVNAAPDYEI